VAQALVRKEYRHEGTTICPEVVR